MYPVGNLFIPVEHGRLEAIIKEPRGERRGAALVLHPHPLHGGTMHNKVAARTARALNDAGCVALRINFRGAGRSTGEHDYARGGEQSDARAALVGVGTPVSIAERGYDFSFLDECRKPILFVHGERDEFGDVGRLKEIVASLPPEASARLVIVPGAGHFFDEQLDDLVRVIREWTEEILKG